MFFYFRNLSSLIFKGELLNLLGQANYSSDISATSHIGLIARITAEFQIQRKFQFQSNPKHLVQNLTDRGFSTTENKNFLSIEGGLHEITQIFAVALLTVGCFSLSSFAQQQDLQEVMNAANALGARESELLGALDAAGIASLFTSVWIVSDVWYRSSDLSPGGTPYRSTIKPSSTLAPPASP